MSLKHECQSSILWNTYIRDLYVICVVFSAKTIVDMWLFVRLHVDRNTVFGFAQIIISRKARALHKKKHHYGSEQLDRPRGL